MKIAKYQATQKNFVFMSDRIEEQKSVNRSLVYQGLWRDPTDSVGHVGMPKYLGPSWFAKPLRTVLLNLGFSEDNSNLDKKFTLKSCNTIIVEDFFCTNTEMFFQSLCQQLPVGKERATFDDMCRIIPCLLTKTQVKASFVEWASTSPNRYTLPSSSRQHERTLLPVRAHTARSGCALELPSPWSLRDGPQGGS